MKVLTTLLTLSGLLGGVAAAQDQNDNRPGQPADAPIKKLLSEIDARELPNDYKGGENAESKNKNPLVIRARLGDAAPPPAQQLVHPDALAEKTS